MNVTNHLQPLTSPTNPHHIARAYGVRPGSPAASAPGVQRSTATAAAAPTGNVQAVHAPGVRNLVAGVVPGRVEFDASGEARVGGSGAYALYGRPADKNAVATAVNVGRTLDVKG